MSEVIADPPPVQKKRISILWIILGIVFLLGILLSILMVALAPSVAGWVMKEAALKKTVAAMKDVEIATGHYKVEYDRYPEMQDDTTLDTEIRSHGAVIRGLLGDNRKQIKFFEAPMSVDGKFGLMEVAGDWLLVDMWGELYYLVFDSNYDGKISNPDGGADITKSVVVYSAGPDGDPKTWSDNIKSWR